ncbi:Myc-type, basic helix-loop-helix (bHLH) domain [Dillenia turbinata]|uniref:Myc-type, basic helix-loop-helix (BHLH) domain n=1 Tax=Dillenia turbinata TaxID=194707 RepID=A0AAN8UK58_9MAGN
MALEAVIYQQEMFGCNNWLGGNWECDYDFGLEKVDEEEKIEDPFGNRIDICNNYEVLPYLSNNNEYHQMGSSIVADFNNGLMIIPNFEYHQFPQLDNASTATTTTTAMGTERVKRRRSRARRNKEEIENQRMTHIAVERNRRKQMNEYLSVLRSLMPESYVQRGDQASIIGGAINFVKELEQQVHSLGAQKLVDPSSEGGSCSSGGGGLPFAEFFSFPQYSTTSTCGDNSLTMNDRTTGSSSSIADIEVTMVESHASLKIRSKRRPKQLLKIVSGLQSLCLTILHLNVSTHDQFVLYSISVKVRLALSNDFHEVEDDCNLTSVDEIATAVYEILRRVQEEATASAKP